MTRSSWDRRRRRAQELLARRPSTSQLLAFYDHLLRLQQDMRRQLDWRSASRSQGSASFFEQLDVEFAAAWVPRLLDIAQKHGPAKLAGETARMNSAAVENQPRMLAEFLRNRQEAGDATSSFVARVLLQPCAELEASRRPLPPVYTKAVCPICASRPQLAVLRPEGDGGKRHLVCSFCFTEWEFRRVICPICEETDKDKLPRYSAEDPIAVRVEACDTCKAYLKSFDMTVDGLMVPEVDEIASVALDLWAVEHGYYKFQLNLLGF